MRHMLLLVLQMNRLPAGLTSASFFIFLMSAWEQENNELGRKPSRTAFLPIFFIQLLQSYVCRFACTYVRINVRSRVCIHIVCVCMETNRNRNASWPPVGPPRFGLATKVPQTPRRELLAQVELTVRFHGRPPTHIHTAPFGCHPRQFSVCSFHDINRDISIKLTPH